MAYPLFVLELQILFLVELIAESLLQARLVKPGGVLVLVDCNRSCCAHEIPGDGMGWVSRPI